MDDVVTVQVLQTEDNAADKELDNIFRKPLTATQLKPQISTRHVIHDQVKVQSILECVNHVDYEGMLELSQQLSLVED